MLDLLFDTVAELVSVLPWSFITPSNEIFKSFKSLSESSGDCDSEYSCPTVELSHCGFRGLQQAIRARYVLQCSGHEWMFFNPFCLHFNHSCLCATSFNRVSTMDCWSCGPLSKACHSVISNIRNLQSSFTQDSYIKLYYCSKCFMSTQPNLASFNP